MTRPDVSVVIPCHNDGKYLSEAIESVLMQEHDLDSIEVIVVDDHSTDEETLGVLERWRQEGPAVRVLRNTGAGGPSSARNVGIAAAGSHWIALLDADDVWLAGSLQARWEAAKAHKDAEWIVADFQEWYEDGSLEETGHYHKDDFLGKIVAPAYLSGSALRLERPIAALLRSSLPWTGTVLVTRALVERVGGFEPRLRGPEDLHLWYRLALQADLFFVPRVVALYRQHASSLISRTRRAGQIEGEWDRLYRLLQPDPAFRPWRRHLRRKLSNVHESCAWDYRARHRSWSARWAAARAVRYTPLRAAAWQTLLGTLLRP